MPARKVALSKHQHEFVDALVRSGRYRSASEVLREGLRLIEQREQLDTAGLKALQEANAAGWADIAADRYVDVGDDEIEAFIGVLGRQASTRAGTESR